MSRMAHGDCDSARSTPSPSPCPRQRTTTAEEASKPSPRGQGPAVLTLDDGGPYTRPRMSQVTHYTVHRKRASRKRVCLVGGVAWKA
jgi:hypothetical protein